jgi:DNA-binding XRE family transcriptional regulator
MLREAAYYRELGQRIQRARMALGLTQEGLASLVGLTRTSMVNIEKGRQKVLAHTLVRFARSLNVRIEALAQDPTEELKIDELLKDFSESTKKFVRSAIAPAQKEKA